MYLEHGFGSSYLLMSLNCWALIGYLDTARSRDPSLRTQSTQQQMLPQSLPFFCPLERVPV